MSVPSQLVNCSVIPPLGNSDHNGINVTLKWSRNTHPVKTSKRTIWRYAHADFDKANQLIVRTDWSFLRNVSNVDTAWDLWEQKFRFLLWRSVSPKPLFHNSGVFLGWTGGLKQKSGRETASIGKLEQLAIHPCGLSTCHWGTKLYNCWDSQRRIAWERMSNLGSKQFWKIIKYLKKTSSQIPTLKIGATEASSNIDKASLLNEMFSKNFNDALPPLSELDRQCFLADPSSPPPEDILCTEQEIFNLLIALDTNKASGPDGISGKMLKGTAISITPVLTELFNLSLTSGRIPSKWKLSSVVPIPKSSGSADNPSNYRPISLLSVVSKIMERHIFTA